MRLLSGTLLLASLAGCSDATDTSTPTGATTTTATSTTTTTSATTDTSTTTTTSTTSTTTDPTECTLFVCHPEQCPAASDATDKASNDLDTPWATLSHALGELEPGDTLCLRGGPAGSDDNTPCAFDGDKDGSCWTEVEEGANTGGPTSPLHWSKTDTDVRRGGSGEDARVTIACYGSEVCIIEPEYGFGVVYLDTGTGGDNCSYLTFRNLVFDGRNVSNTTFRNDPPNGADDPPEAQCQYVTITGDACVGTWGAGEVTCRSRIRHGQYVAGLALFGSHWLVEHTEFTENGCQTTTGDHDHDIYLQGVANTFRRNRLHHSMQGIQVWNTSLSVEGANQFVANEIDHEGFNAWCDNGRPDGLGMLGVYGPNIGSGTVIGGQEGDGNWIHDNEVPGSNGADYGISIGAFAPCPSGVVASHNYLWSNRSGDDGTVYVDDACTATITPNYGAP